MAQEVFDGYNPYYKHSAIQLVDDLEHSIIGPLEDILDKSAQEERDDSISALEMLNDNMSTIVIWLTVNVIVVLLVGVAVAWGLSNIIRQRLNIISEKGNRHFPRRFV
ncbi:hypothetical protein QW180_16865 [Vibrio sinaloensis]|nr:hypothetical protein [Vibrio sinaloensis]